MDEPFSFVSKAGNALIKRDITIADPSECSIKLTLWNEASNVAGGIGDILMAKRVRVNDYQGALSVTYDRLNSEIQFEPKISGLEAVQQLKQWQSTAGALQGIK